MDDGADWSRIKALFGEAIDLVPAERPAFLGALPANDAAAVAGLLDHHRETEAGAVASPLRLLRTDRSGLRIGPFRLVRPIGEGGFSSVYLAERDDGAFEQQVAVKLLAARFESADARAQFQREQQTLARLSHPNIARLFDGGFTGDGLGYVVMELVEGVPLSVHAAALPLDDRLALFDILCGAVAHAHRSLFLHRDLKPANILVTPAGELKLLDFGLARALDATEAEAPEARMLTPAYASPEQHEGQAHGTGTDIWSLGVILYELACGRLPFAVDGLGAGEAGRIVREAPVPPSAGVTKLRRAGDFDAIVARALAKASEDRYPSVAALAEDVARYRCLRPVTARPGHRLHRATLFVRRNALPVAAGAALGLAIGAGVLSTVHQAERAERRFEQVRKLANAVLNDYQAKLELLPGATEVRRQMIADSLAYLDSLAAEAGDDPALIMELSLAYEQIGDIQGNDYTQNLGLMRDADASFAKSLKLREALYARDPGNAEFARQLAIAWGRLGDQAHSASRPQQALAHYLAGLAIIERAARTDASMPVRRQLARKHLELATVLGWPSFPNLGRTAEALAHARAGVAIAEEIFRAAPKDVTARWAVLPQRQLEAVLLIEAGRQAEALRSVERGRGLARAWQVEDPGNEYARDAEHIAIEKIAEIHAETGRAAEGIAMLAARLDAERRAAAADAADVRRQRAVMVVAQKLAVAFMAGGQADAAVDTAAEGLAAAAVLVKASDRVDSRHDLIEIGIVHARALSAAGRHDPALARYAALAAALAGLPGGDPGNVRTARFRAELEGGWALALQAGGRGAEALPHFERAITVYGRLSTRDPTNVTHRRALARLLAARAGDGDVAPARDLLAGIGAMLPADTALLATLSR